MNAQALSGISMIGTITRPLLAALILAGLAVGLRRAGPAARRPVLTWSLVAAGLIVWLGGLWTLAANGAFVSAGPSVGEILAPVAVLIVVALTLLFRSRTIAATLDAAPLWPLIALQAWRVTGVAFVLLWARGVLPGLFAIPAGVGDTLEGLLAIGTALALVMNRPWAARAAWATNLFGLADLINAVTMAVITLSAGGGGAMLGYPMIMVPTFGVPLAFILHGLSIKQLWRRRSRAADRGPGRGAALANEPAR